MQTERERDAKWVGVGVRVLRDLNPTAGSTFICEMADLRAPRKPLPMTLIVATIEFKH